MDTATKIEKKSKADRIEALARGNRWAASPPSRGALRRPAAGASAAGPRLRTRWYDGPLALAHAPNPHMPQCVSIRNCPQITPPLRSSTFWAAQTPTHISRPSPPRHLTAYIARRHRFLFFRARFFFLQGDESFFSPFALATFLGGCLVVLARGVCGGVRSANQLKVTL
jgi:hypothetical protein